MKPTKKIISEFPTREERLLKAYEDFKQKQTTRTLAALAIQWGIFSTIKETFQLISSITDSQLTEIYFAIQDYSKDIGIF